MASADRSVIETLPSADPAVRRVLLRDRNGRRREFVFKPGGFLIEGKPVTLVRPKPTAAASPRVTN